MESLLITFGLLISCASKVRVESAALPPPWLIGRCMTAEHAQEEATGKALPHLPILVPNVKAGHLIPVDTAAGFRAQIRPLVSVAASFTVERGLIASTALSFQQAADLARSLPPLLLASHVLPIVWIIHLHSRVDRRGSRLGCDRRRSCDQGGGRDVCTVSPSSWRWSTFLNCAWLSLGFAFLLLCSSL